MDTIGAIKAAAQQRVLLSIEYKDSKGNVTARETEPYELRDDSYFGWDVNKQEIRNFKLDRIMSTSVTKIPYIARFAVQV